MLKPAEIDALDRMLDAIQDAAAFDIRLHRPGYAIRLKREVVAERPAKAVEAKTSGVVVWSDADVPLPPVGAEVQAREILGFIISNHRRVALRAHRKGIVAKRLAEDGERVTAGQALLILQPPAS